MIFITFSINLILLQTHFLLASHVKDDEEKQRYISARAPAKTGSRYLIGDHQFDDF